MENRVGPILTCRTANCDVRSDQDTGFNIKRRCCKVCWDEACDIDDGRKIMTQWNTEDIEAAKLKGQEIAEAVLLEMQKEDDLINDQKVDEVLIPAVFAPVVVFDSSTSAVETGFNESFTTTFIIYVIFS